MLPIRDLFSKLDDTNYELVCLLSGYSWLKILILKQKYEMN